MRLNDLDTRIRVSVSHQINFEKALQLSAMGQGKIRTGIIIASGFKPLVGGFITDDDYPVGWLLGLTGIDDLHERSLNVYVAKQDDEGNLLPSRLNTQEQQISIVYKVKSVVFLSERFNVVRETL